MAVLVLSGEVFHAQDLVLPGNHVGVQKAGGPCMTPADAYLRQQHAELVVQSAQKEREERYATIFFTALMACVLCCFAVLLFATLFMK